MDPEVHVALLFEAVGLHPFERCGSRVSGRSTRRLPPKLVVVAVICYVDIDPAVAVEVHERRGHAPRALARAGTCGDVRKGAVPVVAKHRVWPEPGDVHIHPPVVVLVAGGNAHAVSPRVDPALVCHVCEAQCSRAVLVNPQVVSVQPISQGQRASGRKRGLVQRVGTEHLCLNQVYVEIAVVVVVQQRTPGSKISAS